MFEIVLCQTWPGLQDDSLQGGPWPSLAALGIILKGGTQGMQPPKPVQDGPDFSGQKTLPGFVPGPGGALETGCHP